MSKSSPAAQSKRGSRPAAEDTVMRRLTPRDKERIGVDAWEPSLLRKMLRAKAGRRSSADAPDV